MIRYRANVALILRNAAGEVLIGERLDAEGAWQFPQGGVDAGESAEVALVREVEEELSLRQEHFRVIDRKGPYRYEFENGRTKDGCGGQEQTYFLAELIGDGAGILTEPKTPEFRRVRWIAPAEFQLDWLVSMKWGVYRDVFHDFFKIEL